MKILLVDQEPRILQAFELILLAAFQDATVLLAETHEKGLDLLMEHPDIEAIILDDNPDLFPDLLSRPILAYVREKRLKCVIMAASSSLRTNHLMVLLGCTHMAPQTEKNRVAKDLAPFALISLLATAGEPVP